MQQETQKTTSTTTPGAYRFTGAELAAIRLVELMSEQPKVKEFLSNVSPNPEVWQKEVTKIAEYISDPEKKSEFLKLMNEQKPFEELKDLFIKFIAKNFEHHEIEYAINLATDQRLAGLLLKGGQIAQDLSQRLAAGMEAFMKKL